MQTCEEIKGSEYTTLSGSWYKDVIADLELGIEKGQPLEYRVKLVIRMDYGGSEFIECRNSGVLSTKYLTNHGDKAISKIIKNIFTFLANNIEKYMPSVDENYFTTRQINTIIKSEPWRALNRVELRIDVNEETYDKLKVTIIKKLLLGKILVDILNNWFKNILTSISYLYVSELKKIVIKLNTSENIELIPFKPSTKKQVVIEVEDILEEPLIALA